MEMRAQTGTTGLMLVVAEIGTGSISKFMIMIYLDQMTASHLANMFT